MFEKPQAVRLAAYSGMLAALVYLVMGISATNAVRTLNPFARVDWELQMNVAAARFPSHFFAGGLLVLIHLMAAFFFLALAYRASRMHPTTAGLGGGLVLSAVAVSGMYRIWEVFGTDLVAVRYVTLENAEMKAALQHAFQLSSTVESVLIATAISLSIPGFLVLAYSLKDCTELGRLLSPAFFLASVTQFLAILAVGHAFNVGRVEHTFSRLTVAISVLGSWGMPVVATALGAFWLLGQAFTPGVMIREMPSRQGEVKAA